MTRPELRVLLDEHYPGWLADALGDAGIDAAAVVQRDDLRGAEDAAVLRAATLEHRIVITEDVTTFGFAIDKQASHAGVVFCHHARFPRSGSGLERLRVALIAFAADPPSAAGERSFIWWLR